MSQLVTRASKGVVAATTLFAAVPALAQETASAAAASTNWTSALAYAAAGIGIGLAVLGGANGQGKAAAAAYEGIGRNPQASDKLFTPLILGLALIEFQTILAFVIAILLVTTK